MAFKLNNLKLLITNRGELLLDGEPIEGVTTSLIVKQVMWLSNAGTVDRAPLSSE